MAHRNVPIFIPHLGCPHQCVFCNQCSISEHESHDLEGIEETVRSNLSTMRPGDEAEIAFFGGSFTGIDQDLMVRLLELAQHYVRRGEVSSIRLSTRPDYISEEILEILSRYAVRQIELGIQSMDDEVLLRCQRGHTAEQTRKACRAILEAGFVLTGQMMIGLPCATPESERMTAREICDMGASYARIYPTVVFYETPLARDCQEGVYTALSVQEAVERSADVLEILTDHGVECIRIGLCATESLTSCEKVCAGPNHPALGELVWNEYYYRKLLGLPEMEALRGKRVALLLPRGLASKVIGQHRCNIERLLRETGTVVQKVIEDPTRTDVGLMPWE